MSSKAQMFLWGSIIVVVFIVLMVWNMVFDSSVPHYQNAASRDLTADELAPDTFFQSVPPMDVLVRFLAPAEFERMKDDKPSVAFTIGAFGARPCTVFLSAGPYIQAWPKKEKAIWVGLPSQQWQDLFAHEFLHCLYPNWHEPWSKAYVAGQQIETYNLGNKFEAFKGQ